MKKIKVNCVEMVREIRDQLYLETLNQTDQEKMAAISSAAHAFENRTIKKKVNKKLKAA